MHIVGQNPYNEKKDQLTLVAERVMADTADNETVGAQTPAH